jgi:hypothetical protein
MAGQDAIEASKKPQDIERQKELNRLAEEDPFNEQFFSE